MDLETLDKYFSFHPLESNYFSFSRESREGALRLAIRDVLCGADLDEFPERPSQRLLAAVCEQAIFLLLNPKVLAGSQSLPSGNNLGPRARCMLPPPPLVFEQNELFAPCNISRG